MTSPAPAKPPKKRSARKAAAPAGVTTVVTAPSAPMQALSDVSWSVLAVFGFVSIVLTFLEKLDDIIALGGIAKIAVDNWRLWTVDFWQSIFRFAPVPSIMIPSLSMSVFVLLLATGGRLAAHVHGENSKVQQELSAEWAELEKEPPPSAGKLALQLTFPVFTREFWRASTWLNPFIILMLAFMLAYLIGTDAEPSSTPVETRIEGLTFMLGLAPGALAYFILPAKRLHRLLWLVIIALLALVGLSYASQWLPLLKELTPPAK